MDNMTIGYTILCKTSLFPSPQSFQHWKQNKDAMIKRELHKKNEAKEMEEEEKRIEERKKQKDRESAFRGWLVLCTSFIHDTLWMYFITREIFMQIISCLKIIVMNLEQ